MKSFKDLIVYQKALVFCTNYPAMLRKAQHDIKE